jgi:hypothetical protein
MSRTSITSLLAMIGLLPLPGLATADTIPNITGRVRPSTIQIKYEYTDDKGAVPSPETGSGFIVGKSGLVITAYHVIERWLKQLETERPKHAIQARTYSMHNEPPGSLTVVDWDEIADVALLKFQAPQHYPPLPLCFVTDLASGTEIVAFGFPLNHEFTPFSGLIANDDGPEARWSANVDFEAGTSGGPVVDMDGRVIGLVKGGLGNVTAIRYVTQVVRASAILQKMGIGQNCAEKSAVPATADRTALTSFTSALSSVNLGSFPDWIKLLENQKDAIRQLQGQNLVSENQLRGLLQQVGPNPGSSEQLQQKITNLAQQLKQVQATAAAATVTTFGSDDQTIAKSTEDVKVAVANGDLPAATKAVSETEKALDSWVWRWPPGQPKVIPVCWENGDAYTKEKQIVREAVAATWEAASQVRFTGWQSCQTDGRGVRIFVKDDSPTTLALGPRLDGVHSGVVLNFEFKLWGATCQTTKEACIHSTAVHVFGHVLGFSHEQNRPDAPPECRAMSQGTNVPDTLLAYGPYDPHSVMNYCNPVWNNGGVLSAGDKRNVAFLYGAPPIAINP